MAVILNYKTQIQILDQWCWAAVASSVSFKYSPTGGITQSNLAAALIDPTCDTFSTDDPNSAPTVCNVDFDLEQALIRTNNLVSPPFNGSLSLKTLCAEIDNGRPVCCQIYWPDLDKSHYITLFGYIGPKIVIGDPDTGVGVCSLNYSELIDGYRTGQWKRSYYTRPPI